MATLCYICPLCSVPSPSLKLYVSHLRITHAKDKSFSVLCGVSGCREVFRTFSAFNSHIYRHHRAEVGVDQGLGYSACSSNTLCPLVSDLSRNESNGLSSHVNIEEACVMDDHFESAFSEPHEATFTQASATSDADQAFAAAKMLLALREGHQVSQVALAEVISGCRLLCNHALNRLKMDIAGGVDCSEDRLINFEDYDPFKNIDTNYLFEKYCVQHLGCLVSVSFLIGRYEHLNPVMNMGFNRVIKYTFSILYAGS